VPKTLFEVERALGALRRDPTAVAAWLRSRLPAPEAALPALATRRTLEPDLLSAMLQALAAEARAAAAAPLGGIGGPSAEAYYLRFLRGLAGTGGWEAAAAMMEDVDRAAALLLLRAAAAAAAAGGAPSAAVLRQVEAVAAAFRVPVEAVFAATPK